MRVPEVLFCFAFTKESDYSNKSVWAVFSLIWYYLCGKKWSQLCAACAWNSMSLYQGSVKATEQCSLVVLFTLLYCSHSFNLCGKKSAAVFPLTWNRLCSTFTWSFLFPVYYIMELIASFDLGHSVNGILFTEAFPCWKPETNILILRGRKTCKYLTLQFTILVCCRVHGISKFCL